MDKGEAASLLFPRQESYLNSTLYQTGYRIAVPLETLAGSAGSPRQGTLKLRWIS